MNRIKQTPPTVFNLMKELFQLVNPPSAAFKDKLKIYSCLLQAEHSYSEVARAIGYFKSEKIIPMDSLKALAEKLDAIIGVLGTITLAMEVKNDVTSVVVEVSEKLQLKDASQVKYLEKQLVKHSCSLERSLKDKHLTSCLDYLKERCWVTLETLDRYAMKQYKQSLF